MCIYILYVYIISDTFGELYLCICMYIVYHSFLLLPVMTTLLNFIKKKMMTGMTLLCDAVVKKYPLKILKVKFDLGDIWSVKSFNTVLLTCMP